MAIQLSDVTVSVNNEAVFIIPNTCKFTEGKGEQTIRAASGGGGQVQQIYANNIESNFSMVSFELPSTTDAIEKAREWKSNFNQNLVQISGKTPDGKRLTRTFSQAALLPNYEVALGSDTNISIEFTANPAV